MRPVSESAARIAGHNFSRKYIALGRIVEHWKDIVGAELAGKTQPSRLNYRKTEGRRARAHVTLEIAASSADSTTLHYQKDLILERINQIFGERWVSDIKFVNKAESAPPGKRKKRSTPLTIHEKKLLSDMVSVVTDEEIRERLLTLGQGILMEEKNYESEC